MASKRRAESQNLDDSEPVCKKLKEPDYFSELPTEMLLEIFQYCKKKGDSIKNLAQTCSRFNEILTPRLELRLDFDRIAREGYPVIQRSYKTIQIVGSEIDTNCRAINELLVSSKYERKKELTIGNLAGQTKVELRTLLFLLRTHGIFFLHMRNLKVLSPRLKFNAIRDEEYPKLSRMIKLFLNDNKGPFLSVFKKKAADLRVLIVVNQNVTKEMRKFITSQKRLLWLHSPDFIEMKAGEMPELLKLDFHFKHALLENQNIFAFAPKVRNLRLLNRFGAQNAQLLLRNTSTSIQTIHSHYAEMPPGFSATAVLQSYPSLIEFKSPNYQWTKK